LELTTR